MAQYIRLEFSGDGDVYFEKTLDAPTPLCFQAFKVHAKETPDEGTHDGGIERVCMLKKMPRIKLRGKRFIANFINSFIPNQAKLGIRNYIYSYVKSIQKTIKLLNHLPHKSSNIFEELWRFYKPISRTLL